MIHWFSFWLFRFFSKLFVSARKPPYFIARIIELLLKRILRYRKDVIEKNIKQVFPNYSKSEIKLLRNKFYKQLSRTFAEVLYTYSHPAKIPERVSYSGFEEINKELKKGNSVILSGGHFYNWEWNGICLTKATDFPVYGIYKPLSNPYFEKHFFNARSFHGVRLVTMRSTKQIIEAAETNEEASIYVLAADQSPSHVKKAIWINFFNKKTAFFPGIENFAKRYDLPVFYLQVENPKKGYYHCRAIQLFAPDQQWTKVYARQVESSVYAQPHAWLWSHNRWKHEYKNSNLSVKH